MNKKVSLIVAAVAFLAIIYAALAADTTAPAITLLTPANGTLTYLNRSNFTFTPSDDSSIIWCKMRYGDVIQKINSNVSVNATNNFTELFVQNGTINWTVECSDNSTNVGNASRILIVNYDIKAPEISLNIGGSNVSEDGIGTFNYSVIENLSGIKECRLFVNGQQKGSSSTTVSNNTTNNFRGIQLENGVSTWGINCTDNAGNEGTSQLATLDVRLATNLTVQLVSPADRYNSSTRTFDFRFIPTSNEIINFCGVYFNGTLNLSATNIVANVTNNFTNIKLNEGIWGWHIVCKTQSGLTRNSSLRNVIANLELLASTYISVTPVSPDNNAIDNKGVVTFLYTPKSVTTLKSCELITNGSSRQISQSVKAAVANSFDDIELSDGVWEWFVRCTNVDNNIAYSPARTLTVVRTGKPLPIAQENFTAVETELDKKALEEKIGSSEKEKGTVVLFTYVILLSGVLALAVFVFSQKEYREKFFGLASPPKIYAKEQLKTYIDKLMRKGVSEERIKRHLRKYNWAEKDVEQAFREVYGEMQKRQTTAKRQPLKPPPMPPKEKT